jgi:hypothetical protein
MWCEDKEYDDRAYMDEKNQMMPYGKLLCKKLVNSYGEWKGF